MNDIEELMKLKGSTLFALGTALLMALIGAYFYPSFPKNVATHWNAKGEVDGYMPKFWGIFLFPVLFLIIALIFIAIPKIDPLRKNLEKFIAYYDGFIVVFSLFMLTIFLQVILWNLGIEISPNIVISASLGLLVFYLGVVLENSKRNLFVGIRTPWTLQSDVVWAKTHKLGGILFRISGVISLLGILAGSSALFFILAPLIASALITIVYSYIAYKKEEG
ncbi:MAG: SdpI family protein [Myxococcota bacterium]